MKRILFLFSLLTCWVVGFSQGTITTVGVYPDNNGSSAVSFEITTTAPIEITGISNVWNTGVTSSDIWIRQGGVANATLNGSGDLVVSAANGWSIDQTATVSATANGVIDAPITNLTPILIPANTTVGFVITGGMGYSGSGSTPLTPTDFVDGPVTLRAGGDIAGLLYGHGGTITSMTNQPRGFIGSITYDLAVSGSCPDIFNNFVVDSISATAAKVSWTPGATNSSFYLEYGLTGFTPGTGTKITGSYPGAQPPVILTALTPSTTYDYYFGEICNSGADSVSFPAAQTFTTTGACASVANLQVTDTTAFTTDIAWTHAGGNAVDFEVIYGVSGFDPATGGSSLTATASPFTVSGLTPSTDYDFYVISNCGATAGIGDTVGPVSSKTPCAPFTATYSNNFDNETDGQLAGCWEQYASYNPANAYARVENLGTPRSGTLQLAMYNYFGFAATDTLISISPEFSDMIAGDKQIRFHVKTSDDRARLFIVTLDGNTPNATATFIDTIDFPTINDYQEVILPLTTANNYNGTDRHIGFVYDLSTTAATFDYIYIDDFVYEDIPTCSKVSNLFLAGVTNTSATIGFDGRGATAVEYEFGPTGFIQGTNAAGIVSSTANPFTISSLPGNTEFDVYVRNDCGNGDVSVWEGPFTFRTLCNPINVTYSTGFENDPQLNVPLCWGEYNTNSPSSYVRVDDLTFTNVPFAGVQALYIYSGNGSAANDTLAAISPQFSDLTAGDKRIRFQANVSNLNADLIIATTSTALGTSGFNILDTISFATINTYEEIIFNFNTAGGYNGTDEFIVLMHNLGQTFSYVRIDDFTYENAPACVPPLSADLGVFGVTATGATTFWGAGSQGIKTYVEVGPLGFTPGTGLATVVDSTVGTVDTLAVTGLTAQTDYEFYVQDSCALDGLSPWVGPFAFTTLCNALTAPYTEDFESFTVGYYQGFENCWTIINGVPNLATNTAGYSWELRNTAQTSSGTGTGPSLDNTLAPATGGKFFNADVSYTAGDSSILESPLVDISALTRPSLEFYLHRLGTQMGDFFVDIHDGTQWIRGVVSETNQAGVQTSQTDPYTQYIINLAPYVTSTNTIVQARFRTISNGCCAGDNGLDDISFINGPSCPAPTGLNAINITSSTADIDLVATGATSYNVEFGPTGFTQGSGTGTIVNNATLPVGISGLSPNTFYDVYVQVDCSPNGTSVWVGPITFKTPCLAALSGTYTIGGTPSTTNFATLDSAIAELNGCGVSGPVTFNLSGGTTYNQVVLNSIFGVSAVNTVTFNGNLINPDTIGGFELNGSDWVTLNNMYIRRTSGFNVRIHNQANNNTIQGCTLESDQATTSSLNSNIALTGSATSVFTGGDHVTNLVVDNNTFIGGWAAFSSYGLASARPRGVIFTNNTINNTYTYGAYVFQTDSAEIRNNTVNGFRSTFNYGYFLSSVDGAEVTGNTAYNATYGLSLANINLASPNGRRMLIANNMLQGSTYGLWMQTGERMDVFHNTAFGGRGAYIGNFSGVPSNIDIRNNIFGAEGTLQAIFVNGVLAANSTLDYNAYDTTAGGAVASWSGTIYNTLGAWTTAVPTQNANSVQGNVGLVSATDFHLLGGLANNSGDNSVGILTDIDGDVRPASGSTVVDMGADEYTPVTDDLGILSAEFDRNSACLTTNDTIVVEIQNTLGATKNFATNNLSIDYSVTGPVNTAGTFILNTGTLALNATLRVRIPGIDMSVPGNYSVIANLIPNVVNLAAINDSLIISGTDIVGELFNAKPDTVVFVNSATDTVEIETRSPLFGGGGFHITEITQYSLAGISGAPTGGKPAYIGADDYIEITGIPGSDLGGYTLEQWNTGLASSFTFPAGTVMSPNGTAIIAVGQLTGSVPSPSDFYYHGTGTFTGTWGSTGPSGRIIKDASGSIVDAVAYAGGSSYTFPAAAGVTAADYSGNPPTSGNSFGIRLEGPDLNSNTGWVASASSPQDPNIVNNLVVIPAPVNVTGFDWSVNGSTYSTSPDTIVTNFTTSGIFRYVATYNGVCGTLTDTVTIVVNVGTPGCPTPTNFAATVNSCDDVVLNWTGAGDSSIVAIAPAGGTPTAGNLIINDSTFTVTTGMPNTSYDVYISNICGGDTTFPAGPFTFSIADEGKPVADYIITAINGFNVDFDGSSSTGSNLTYAWDFGDGTTGTGVTPTHTYTTGGTFNIELTVTNTCGSDDTTKIANSVSIGENPLAQTVSVYPNPTSGMVNIMFNSLGNASGSIRILELSGKEVLHVTKDNIYGEYSGQLDISKLATGVYMLEISSGDLKATRRLLKN